MSKFVKIFVNILQNLSKYHNKCQNMSKFVKIHHKKIKINQNKPHFVHIFFIMIIIRSFCSFFVDFY